MTSASNNLKQTRSSDCLPESRVYVQTARTLKDLESAFRLLQQRYSGIGLSQLAGPLLRIMPYHLRSSSQVFIAKVAGQVVGTVTLVCNSKQGLPMSESFPDAIGNLVQTTNRIGEITSLAVDPEYESRGEVFAQLTRLLTFFARNENLEYLTAVAHPRHAKFYQRAMGAELVSDEKSYAAVEGKPGVAIVWSVSDDSRFRKKWRSHYFDGDFSPLELTPRPITIHQAKYFDILLQLNQIQSRVA